jgi:hypothetical protein
MASPAQPPSCTHLRSLAEGVSSPLRASALSPERSGYAIGPLCLALVGGHNPGLRSSGSRWATTFVTSLFYMVQLRQVRKITRLLVRRWRQRRRRRVPVPVPGHMVLVARLPFPRHFFIMLFWAGGSSCGWLVGNRWAVCGARVPLPLSPRGPSPRFPGRLHFLNVSLNFS